MAPRHIAPLLLRILSLSASLHKEESMCSRMTKVKADSPLVYSLGMGRCPLAMDMVFRHISVADVQYDAFLESQAVHIA